VTIPAHPDDGWGPVGSALVDWLADAVHYVQRVVQRVLSEYELVAAVRRSGADDATAGNAVLIAVVALVVAVGALGVAARTRRRVDSA
jgi:hypothetical protein